MPAPRLPGLEGDASPCAVRGESSYESQEGRGLQMYPCVTDGETEAKLEYCCWHWGLNLSCIPSSLILLF